MTSLHEPFARGRFTWLLGIEDTCVYPASSSEASLDEHELTGHTAVWRDDLRLAAELGATAIRYGVSWPLVHVAPGVFEWGELDAIIAFAVDELGLTIVADLVHYGTPRWLPDAFADPAYADAIAEFAGAFAARYRDRVSHFTPLNEPVTTASFCGLRGVWPPRLHGWEGWVAVAVPIAVGMARTITAIRAANPEAVIVHVEASTVMHADDLELEPHVALLREIGWLPTDLLLGRVDEQHAMQTWLLEHGARSEDLDWLRANPAVPDFIGVNYYPDLTPRRLTLVDDQHVQVSYDKWTDGLREALEGFADRYALPLIITETSIEGDDAVRVRWLRDSATLVEQLRDRCDVRGYTWWPMFDFVDWSWAAGGANVEEFAVELVAADGSTTVGPAPSLGDPSQGKTPFLRRMGVVRLQEATDGSLARVPTPAAALFRELS